jgi:tetratricopeptide (TPR) repeat protein
MTASKEEKRKKTWKFLLTVHDGFSRILFSLALWFLIGILAWLLFRELFKKDQNPTLLATAVVLLLLVVLFERYESVLVSRLKKIGPLELFEEARDVFANFKEIGGKIPLVGSPTKSHAVPHRLTPYESFQCQQGEAAVTLLEFTKSEPEKTRHKDEYFNLLYKVGSCAVSQNDWARATARLDKLRKLSEDSFHPEIVLPLVGLSYFYWALEDRSDTRTERFGKVVEAFAKVIKLGGTSYWNYFHLAYAQDELELYREAVESNKEALKRRSFFAPAKYNTAVSYVHLKDFESAYGSLAQISRLDEDGMTTLKSAFVDEELRPLREHKDWKSKVELFLEQETREA